MRGAGSVGTGAFEFTPQRDVDLVASPSQIFFIPFWIFFFELVKIPFFYLPISSFFLFFLVNYIYILS